MKVNDNIRLIGKTLKGKNRIRESDTAGHFMIAEVRESVAFSDRVGPWLRVENGNPDQGRWVHASEDTHFKIEGV